MKYNNIHERYKKMKTSISTKTVLINNFSVVTI